MRFALYLGHEVVAMFMHAEDAAACIAGAYSDASDMVTLRDSRTGRVLWTEGEDGEAADSFDALAEACEDALTAAR